MRDALHRGVTSPRPDPAELLPEPVLLVLDAGTAEINQAGCVEEKVIALVQGLIAAFAASNLVHNHLSPRVTTGATIAPVVNLEVSTLVVIRQVPGQHARRDVRRPAALAVVLELERAVPLADLVEGGSGLVP
jgi:hypothetical protein